MADEETQFNGARTALTRKTFLSMTSIINNTETWFFFFLLKFQTSYLQQFIEISDLRPSAIYITQLRVLEES